MTISLPKDLLKSLPAPDSKGMIRVKAALQISPDGKSVDLTELNGEPLPSGDEEEKAEGEDPNADPNAPTADDSNPMPPGSEPSMAGAPSSLY